MNERRHTYGGYIMTRGVLVASLMLPGCSGDDSTATSEGDTEASASETNASPSSAGPSSASPSSAGPSSAGSATGPSSAGGTGASSGGGGPVGDDDGGPTGAGSSTGAAGGDDDPFGSGFIENPDLGDADPDCDTFTQSCPPDEKCVPVDEVGDDTWNATRCRPVVPMPGQVEEVCTVEDHAMSGFDSCDRGLLCWEVDSETLQGTCVEMCAGSPEVPECMTPRTTCEIIEDSVAALCVPD